MAEAQDCGRNIHVRGGEGGSHGDIFGSGGSGKASGGVNRSYSNSSSSDQGSTTSSSSPCVLYHRALP